DFHVYIYSNAEKDPDYLALKEERDSEYPDREHIMHVAQLMFCKGFPYSTSTFTRFNSLYKDGHLYYFCPFVIENERPTRVKELGFIKKYALKIKQGNQLTKEDREYDHYRLIIDRDVYEEEGPPPASQMFTI